VLLNEFSDAGIDALTVAAAARGAYDVRMVPGGCICCVGEQDFRRNSLQLVAADSRPTRIIVEPSGIGHPAGIVEELLTHEAAGGLRLEAVIGLVDADRVALLDADDSEPARAAAEIADALALTKADRADARALQKFSSVANSLYPAKLWFGAITDGVLPAAVRELLVVDGRESGSRVTRSTPPAFACRGASRSRG
jgi:G3E family GTPase